MAATDLGQSATQLVAIIGAVGALGTAAFGLVDASKIFLGGISNVGFGHIEKALSPFAPALRSAVGTKWVETVRAHWRNGRPKTEQKSIAVALIQLGLDAETARKLADAGHVDPDALARAIEKLMDGLDLDPAEVNVIGRFRTSVEALMDAAFERAEQEYRNAARFAAGAVAVLLAIVGGGLLHAQSTPYLWTHSFWMAVLVGLVAVPIAPITKDLISSLSAAVRAVKATKTP